MSQEEVECMSDPPFTDKNIGSSLSVLDNSVKIYTSGRGYLDNITDLPGTHTYAKALNWPPACHNYVLLHAKRSCNLN